MDQQPKMSDKMDKLEDEAVFADVNGNRCDRSTACVLAGESSASSINNVEQTSCKKRSSHLISRDALNNIENGPTPNSGIGGCKQIRNEKGHQLKSSSKYIEVDPLESQDLSPASVYLCTAVYSLVPAAAALTSLFLIALLFTRYYYVPLVYFAYMFLDRKTYNRGGRRLDFVYQSRFWSHVAAYFPIKIRRTSDFKLDPEDNYILNYHPHGIAAFGAVSAFATNGLNFSGMFPKITARFMVHETSFMMPIMREVFGSRGDCSVNSSSIDHILSRRCKGNLLTIVVGGLAEADLSNSETLKIVVAERKGFIKKALIHGANIIPCIAFGENSVFNKVDLASYPFWHHLEAKWYQMFKFKHPIYYGRSLLSEDRSGIMPYKRPITVVLGDPIKVTKKESPSQADINELHEEYLRRVRSVYEDNSDLCNIYDRKLEIL